MTTTLVFGTQAACLWDGLWTNLFISTTICLSIPALRIPSSMPATLSHGGGASRRSSLPVNQGGVGSSPSRSTLQKNENQGVKVDLETLTPSFLPLPCTVYARAPFLTSFKIIAHFQEKSQRSIEYHIEKLCHASKEPDNTRAIKIFCSKF